MRAVLFDFNLLRYGLTLALGRVWKGAYTSPLSCLSLAEIPEPVLPGPEWVKIRTHYAGICGTDLSLVRLHTSPMSSVYTSFPFVVGHENLGYIAEAGVDSGFSIGERVVVDIVLPCNVRGIENSCGQCRQQQPQRCENFTRGSLKPGITLGACASTGGSWSQFFLAHKSQVFRVPDTVAEKNAALVEPFCVSLHSVARNHPSDSDTVLVIGAGIIGLTTVASLRALGSRARVIVLARHGFQAELAQAYGADKTLLARRDGQYRQVLARELSGTLAKPVIGAPVMLGGGADFVYDCVGTASSMGEATGFARAGGKVVLMGTAAKLDGLDWTPMWLRELTIVGSMCYGYEIVGGETTRTYQLALDLMASGAVDLAPLLTHTFRIEEWRAALQTAMSKSSSRLVKAAFVFD